MKEFIEKLIERLEEAKFPITVRRGVTINGIPQTDNVILFERAIEIVKNLAAEYNDGWIPFTERELTEDEKESYDFDFLLDCKLPDEDEEILVTYSNGTVGQDIFMRDGFQCYLDSGNEFVTEAIAWQPLPKPYREKE